MKFRQWLEISFVPTGEKARRLVKRWQTRGGRYWYELYRDQWGYGYTGDNAGGGLQANSDEEAIEKFFQTHIAPAKKIDKINYLEV